MDIECPGCGEPWDSYHMQRDEPYEWGLLQVDLENFIESGRFNGADDPALKAAELAGWRFASCSVLSFISCPYCKKKSVLRDASERRAKTAVLAEMLDEDDDVLISMLTAS